MVTAEEIRDIVESAIEARSRIDCEIHDEHHQFIAEFIQENRVRRERWEAIQRQVLGWGIIAFVGTLGTIVAKKFGIDL